MPDILATIILYTSFLFVWLVTNRKDPSRAVLSNWNGIFVIVTGLLLYLGGIILGNVGIFADELACYKKTAFDYKLFGVFIFIYGIYGRGFAVISIKR